MPFEIAGALLLLPTLMSATSWPFVEVVIDGTVGDIGIGAGPRLDLVAADGSTVLYSSVPAGASGSRSLCFENATTSVVEDQLVRVESGGCGTDCTAEDQYQVRAYETTLSLSRFNNSATQTTVLVLQNPGTNPVSGHVWLRDAQGTLIASQVFSLGARASWLLNTAALAPGAGGTATVTHDAPYGTLMGRAVSVEPATGFTFDTTLLNRPR